MALGATVFKVELQISDIDRGYYQTHSLVLAQHPSETDERLMIRLLAFVLFAHDRLEFGRGLSTPDEPDLWQRDLTGVIERWIEVGHPDESQIRRACGRAHEVIIVTYSGRYSDTWWEKLGPGVAKLKNLTVLNVPSSTSLELAAFAKRQLQLQCLIQDGLIQVLRDDRSVSIEPVTIKLAARA